MKLPDNLIWRKHLSLLLTSISHSSAVTISKELRVFYEGMWVNLRKRKVRVEGEKRVMRFKRLQKLFQTDEN